MSNTAAILASAKSPLVVETRSIPSPSASQLLVKNAAIATNPVDWKIQDYGMFVSRYPTILGSDVCGTVEAVGSNVTHFKKGDRVTGYAASITSNEPDDGAFQEYTLLNDNATAKIPDFMSFEEGSILPMAVATSGMGIFSNLAIPKPTGAQQQSGGFLVWGASSSVGSAAVQISSSLGFTVYAVCSPRHHDKAREYGAKHVFDYKDTNVISNILNAAKETNDTVKIAFDAISENGSAEQVGSVLEQQGGGQMVMTLPLAESAKRPENVEITTTGAYRINTDAKDLGAWLFNEWLEKTLMNKTFVPSPAIQRVEGGIASVQKALDLHRKGLSGKKLVIPLL
ncbi:MAG: hypothetical protein Q9183_002192 [Haloplaca sp. 2 TL-2023]